MRPRIGLVLGGGGSRGIAHVGVLQVLVRENIPIDLIVGTSMGGLVGAMFAAGITTEQMIQHAERLKNNSLLSTHLFSARARQRTLRRWLEDLLHDKTFEDLQIPLVVTAVDMLHGREVYLNSGPLLPALLATSAMPAVFPPVDLDGMTLADGGVIDSLCTQAAFAKVDRIIAVDIYPRLDHDNPWTDPVGAIMGFGLPFGLFSGTANATRPPSMLASIWRSMRVMTWYLHEERLKAYPPDVLLHPEVEHYGSLDFRDIDGPLAAGAREAERCLDQIKSLLENRTTHDAAAD